jgi:hypothetical protein
MKKIALALLLFACCLFAADVWQSKPYTEWTDKDLQKMMTNSPWARGASVSTGAPTPPALGGGGGGGRGGGRGGSSGGEDSAPAPISEKGGGSSAPAPGSGSSANVVARWQSALPLKQAFVRLKYGAKAAESDDAKLLLDRQETSYLIVVTGPARLLGRGTPEELKKALADNTFLSSRTKAETKPTALQISVNKGMMDVLFSFPRMDAYSLDDKEVEFSTKFGDSVLKYKFRLKDMVFNGKLEL